MTDQPNFLLVVTDQQRADHLGCYGNPVLRTPHIDSLVEGGRRFDRFYVAAPTCQSNRASLMTGRMPSLNGVRHNGLPLPLDATTFVHILRDAGYRTALLGKAHLQNMTGLPPAQAFEAKPGLRLPSEALREAWIGGRRGDAYELENERNWPRPLMERHPEPFYGFEHFEVATNHGDLVGGDYLFWARERHAEFDSLRAQDNALSDPRYSAPQARRTAIPEELYPSSYVADRTVAWLESHARDGGDAPFFVQMSFPDPHYPFTPPGRYWDLYDPDSVQLPKSFENDGHMTVSGMKAALRAGRAHREGHAPYAVTEREAREIVALTYGMIGLIDDSLGRVTAALDRLGFGENTVVIFTSDHGDHMADHGIMLKSPLHFQGLVRVPFLWRDPNGSSGVCGALGSTIDIAPSILLRAGIQPNNGVQGRDLFDDAAEPDGVMIETDNPFLGGPPMPRTRTLVTRDWRITVHQNLEWGELYDLAGDPDEIENLWDDPAHRETRAALTERMLRRMIDLQENAPLQTGLS